MKPAGRIGVFAGGLAVAFVAAFAIGRFPGLEAFEGVSSSARQGDVAGDHGSHGMSGPAGDRRHGGHSGAESPSSGQPAVSGLSISEAGYTLRPVLRTMAKPGTVDYRFYIVGPDGEVVQDYRMLHERELHLIVARRDLTRFQHVHPKRASDGMWSIDLDLPDAGAYRVFTDVAPVGLKNRAAVTLGTDLLVGGAATPKPPALSRQASVAGVDVALGGTPVAGGPSDLTFAFRRNGEPVTDLKPYLGAFGHLVALREGDLAYTHVHAGDDPGPGEQGGPRIDFTAEFPTAGRYALFLDFQLAGGVHTAAFLVDVPAGEPGSTAGHTGHAGHGGSEGDAGNLHSATEGEAPASHH